MTTPRMTLPDCIRLAEFAHFHQTDQAGHPYVDHPKRVLAAVQTQGAPPYAQMAAILHDVTEDTPFTSQMLLELGVPNSAVHLVTLLDRRDSRAVWQRQVDTVRNSLNALWWTGSEYVSKDQIPSYDVFYYTQIRNSSDALQVKLADIGDNLQPWRLSYLSPHRQEKLRAKYAWAIELLTGDVNAPKPEILEPTR